MTQIVSAGQMQETLHQALAQCFTGLGKVVFETGVELQLLLQAGCVREVLVQDQGQKRRLSGENWKEQFTPLTTGRLVLCKSPGRLLWFERACFDLQSQEKGNNVSMAEIEKLFYALNLRETASILSLRWPQTQARVLFSGSRLGFQRAIFMKNLQFAENDPGLVAIHSQKAHTASVEIYSGGLTNDLWIALHLNVLFEFLCGYLFRQYEYLTGKVMVNSILKNVTIYAAQQDWQMEGINSSVVDETLFASVDEMAEAYRRTLNLIRGQMKSIIGANFLAMVKAQSTDALNPFYLDLYKHYGLDA